VVGVTVAVAGCAPQRPLLDDPETSAAATSTQVATVATPETTTAWTPGASVIVRPTVDAPVRQPPPAAVPGVSLPPAATQTNPDPDVVADAALTAAYGSDTRTDISPLDAQRRALAWLGGGYAAAVRATSPSSAPGAVWNTTADDHPADTATTAERQYTVTQTPVGPGWTGSSVTVDTYVELTRTPTGRWQVTQLSQATS